MEIPSTVSPLNAQQCCVSRGRRLNRQGPIVRIPGATPSPKPKPTREQERGALKHETDLFTASANVLDNRGVDSCGCSVGSTDPRRRRFESPGNCNIAPRSCITSRVLRPSCQKASGQAQECRNHQNFHGAGSHISFRHQMMRGQ